MSAQALAMTSSVQQKHEGEIPEEVEKLLPQQTAAAPESAEPEVELTMQSPIALLLLRSTR